MTDNCFYYVPPWYVRALYRLFPSQHIELKDAPPDTVLCNTTVIQLDWKDRIRCLISGTVRLDMRIYCDSRVTAKSTEAVTSISPPFIKENP